MSILDTVGIRDDPGRFQTMSIASRGDCSIKNRGKLEPYREVNRTDDIAGAQPRPLPRGGHKPDLHDVSDVPGARAKTLHKTLNKVSYVGRNDDIHGSRPKPSSFKTTRHVNPLKPDYGWTHHPVAPPPEPKFIRDSTDTSDIDGTKPRPAHKWATRETMDTSDIPGAKAGWRPPHKRIPEQPRDILNVKDINGSEFKTTRRTDPLNPVHVVNGMKIEDEPGMKPSAFKPGRPGPVLSLTTSDIEGANTDYKPKHHAGGIPDDKRRNFRVINKVDDIEGAVTGTLKRAMKTKRVTDPNERNYPLLDGAVDAVPDTPFTSYAKRLLDPKDAEIARLQKEIANLHKDRELNALRAEVAEMKLQAGSRGPAVDDAPAAGASRGGSRGGAPIGSRGGASDRFVLRSSSGALRVPPSPGAVAAAERPPLAPTMGRSSGGDAMASLRLMTGASRGSRGSRGGASRGSRGSRRMEVEAAAAIDAVRSLPDTPLSRAGSEVMSR